MNKLSLLLLAAASLPLAASAATITRNNTTAANLSAGTSWTGGVAPTSADVALFDVSSPLAATDNLLDTPIAWSGLQVTNISGVLTLGNGANPLTLGSAGIDMSAATQNVYLNGTSLAVGSANQTWTVATGRQLRLGAGNLAGVLTGSATITISGGGLVELNPTGTGASGFSGKWIVNAGSTLRTTRNTSAALGTNTAADALTLNGGTLAVGGFTGSGAQGNWTFNTKITLGSGFTSFIDNQIPAAGTGIPDRWLKLDGAISGSGNLTFNNTMFASGVMMNDELGYILAANNTFTGAMTISANTFVRIGGSAVGTANSSAGSNGSIASTVAITNNGVLRLTRNDGWIFANGMTGSGALKIGGTVGTTTAQSVSLTGANAHTGGTTIVNGTAITGNVSALGAGTVAVNGGVLQIGNGTVNGVTLGSGANLTVASLATLKFFAASSAITLQGVGGYTLTGGAILDLNNAFNAAGSYNLIVSGSGTKTDGVVTFANFDSTNFTASFSQGVLTVSAVPEPSTYGLLGAGALAAAAMVRRRRKTI